MKLGSTLIAGDVSEPPAAMPPPPEVGGGSPPVFAGYERAARFQLRNRWVRSSMIARVGSSRLTRSAPYASVAPLMNEKEADAARKKGIGVYCYMLLSISTKYDLFYFRLSIAHSGNSAVSK